MCGDCEVEEGQLHESGCAQERCPFCGGQLISCDCVYTELGYHMNYEEPYFGLPKRVYVSDNVWEKYIQINMRQEVICLDCFEKITDLIDKADPSHAIKFNFDNDEEWLNWNEDHVVVSIAPNTSDYSKSHLVQQVKSLMLDYGILNNTSKVDFVNYASSKLPEHTPELIEVIVDYLLKEHFKLH